MEKITQIAIQLHDHDFGMTFTHLLETIDRAFDPDWAFEQELSKEVLIKAIYEGIAFHHLLFQLRQNYEQKGYGDFDDTIKYLKDSIKILFNEDAVEDALKGYDGANWFLDIPTGKITSY